MELQLVTATTGEPVTTAEAKTHLRVDHSDEDTLIASQVAAARADFEAATGRQLCQATYDLVLDRFPCGSSRRERAIKFPRAPVQSVTSVTYTASDGTSTTLSSTAYSLVTSWSTAPDPFCGPARLYEAYNDVWPTVRDQGGAVTVRFVAGYGAASAVPELAKAAIKLMVGHLYENREATAEGSMPVLPLGVKRLQDLMDTGDL